MTPGRAGFAFELLTPSEGEGQTDAERMYGGPLRFAQQPHPRVVANFVATIDGVVSLGLHDGTDSSTVSGHDAADRYLMGMLRAAAGAVMIGAGTLRASVGHQWTPGAVAPGQAAELAAYRAGLGLPDSPAPLVVVTGSGQLPSHVALTDPQTEPVVATTPQGLPRVRAAFPRLRTVVAGSGRPINGEDLLAELAAELGPGLVLTEGGPSLVGALLRAGSLHELFLTVAPWLAGRDPSHPRLALVNEFVAGPHGLKRAELVSARRAGDHLFLRYGLSG
ncbi:MAG: dihydrofolate reductase family protein [Candidatus Dormibacteraeota bacterium]|nr:dihydrofolate reductase family protein [Candidatus Dormibacteraeota bacterium]